MTRMASTERFGGVVLVPDLAAVELVTDSGEAPNRAMFSQTVTVAVSMMVSCMTISLLCLSSGTVCPVVMSCWDTRAQRSHRGRNAWPGVCAMVRAQGLSGARRGTSLAELGPEPRSRAPPALAAQRRGIASHGRNGAQRSEGPAGLAQ